MLDIKFIRDNVDLVKEAARKKRVEVDIDRLIEVDAKRRELQSQSDELNRQRNELGQAAKGSKPDTAAIEKGRELKDTLIKIETKLTEVEKEYISLMLLVPQV